MLKRVLSSAKPPLRKIRSLVRQLRSTPQIAELHTILRSHIDAELIFLFPPSLDWDKQLFQRPQQLALALARQGALVFYVQPRVTAKKPPFLLLAERLYLCNVYVETFSALKSPAVYILTWNARYAAFFDAPELIYDYVDELEAFEGDPLLLEKEHASLLRHARLVLATAENLYRQTLPVRPDALLCPNAVDYDHFALARQPSAVAPPGGLASIVVLGKPIVGYYGALARWFDYELLRDLAELRPDLEFVLVGPDHDNTISASGVLELPNVHWLGFQPYEQLPHYLHCFDVAVIPFKLSPVTHSTSPLKLFEYMAGGKPVVITPMHESMRTPGVLVAGSVHEFSDQVDRALQLIADPAYLRQIDEVARLNTWDARARQIMDAMPPALASTG